MPNRSDLTDSNLMTRHNRKRELTKVVVDRMHIGMTHPAMRHFDTYFTITQRRCREHNTFERTPSRLRCVANNG